MMPSVRQLNVTEAMLVWPHAKEMLRAAIVSDDPEQQLREIEAKVATGLETLWQLQDEKGKVTGYAITILYTTSGETVVAQLHVAAAAGLQLLTSHLDEFESWATGIGVDRLEVIGREGWARVLKPYGFSFDHVSLIKRVTKGMH